jgi:hypothetical protein
MTLGPFFDATGAPLLVARPSASELHRENDSFASATPEATVTENVLLGFFAFREPEKVTVCVDGDGGGGGGAGEVTTAEDAELAEVEAAAFVAMTATRSVEPTSMLVSPKVEAVEPKTSAQTAPVESQRFHW